MREVQAGRLDRFARLVARHQSALFRYAHSRLGSRVLAEDAVQETLLAAYQARETFDLQQNFRAWLWAILVNKCRRMGRQRARADRSWREVADRTRVDHQPDAADRLQRNEQKEKLAELLDRLPADQAEAIRLRFFSELGFEEVGGTLGCSAATAKSRVRYGLEKLARMLKSGQEIFL